LNLLNYWSVLLLVSIAIGDKWIFFDYSRLCS